MTPFRIAFVLPLFLLAAACASGPRPVPQPHERPETQAPPPSFALTSVTPRSASLMKLVLSAEGEVHVDARDLRWTVRHGERVIGEGRETITPDENGAFSLTLPLTLGKTFEQLQPYQGSEAMELVVTAALGEGGAALTDSRSVRVRAPQVPQVDVVSVQGTRGGPAELTLTYVVTVRNPNPFEVRAGRLDYTALLDGRPILATDLVLATRVPASGEATWDLPAEANVETWGADLGAALRRTELPWGFRGTLSVDGVSVPFDLSGDLKISGR